MALFSQNKKAKTAKAKTAPKQEKTASGVVGAERNLAAVLKAPRMTEKTVAQGDRNVYVFVVDRKATKFHVRDAVQAQYKVTPVKINIVNKSPRAYNSRSKGRTITESGMKKAYVYLKKGDSISVV